MPNSRVSIDEFFSRRAIGSSDGVMYRVASAPRSFDPATRSARFVMTDETVDSYGDIVRAGGADLRRFNSNPICLLNHRSDRVIGTWSDVKQAKKSLEGTATIASEGTSEHVDETYALMSQGILRAASIGFIPRKIERIKDAEGNETWSFDILEYDLFECSICSIPANPAALAKSIQDGHGMARELLEQVLDEYVKTPAGLIVPRAEYEAAYKAANGDRMSLLAAKIDELNAKIDGMATAPVVIEQEPTDADFEREAQSIKTAMETSVEASLAEFAPKIDGIKSDDKKSGLRAILDGIKSLFAAPAETETEVKETVTEPAIIEIPAVEMTDEKRAEILARAQKFA